MRILMAATENAAFAGGKVGGIGDVIKEAPAALAAKGHAVTVVIPGYQFFSTLPEATEINSLTVEFGGALETVHLYRLSPDKTAGNPEYLVIDHPLFAACGKGKIYCHDQWEPFATDATKFALFSQAVCYALLTGALQTPDVIHLHDWHVAPVLLLREFVPAYRALKKIRTVFTIHNLSLQGVRPLRDNASSLQSWFPQLRYKTRSISDPLARDCVNLMRAAINLADRVHVVSPTYAREILLPSDSAKGFIGGEQLEKDLQRAKKQQRLFGILNGCDYSVKTGSRPTRATFIRAAMEALDGWVSGHGMISSAHYHALRKLHAMQGGAGKPDCIVASVGRLTAQKVSLLREELGAGVTVMDALLETLGNGLMIMLGSGDKDYEEFMCALMTRHENFIFLQGYSDSLAALLYAYCDLFLMPSTYEPCGISQMQAMREGKPCLVHAVGGLADTVKHSKNGFSFRGASTQQQAKRLYAAFGRALQLRREDPAGWNSICEAAAAARFSWDNSVSDYEKLLYS